jgi:hypothetical protein
MVHLFGNHADFMFAAGLGVLGNGVEQQVEWTTGKPGAEDLLLSTQADTEAYFGRLWAARELSHRAVESARRAIGRTKPPLFARRMRPYGRPSSATRRKLSRLLSLPWP